MLVNSTAVRPSVEVPDGSDPGVAVAPPAPAGAEVPAAAGAASAHVAALRAAAELVAAVGDAAELSVTTNTDGQLNVQVWYRGQPAVDADADRDRLAGVRALARLLGVAVVVGFDTPERLTVELADAHVGGVAAVVWTTVTDPGVRAEAVALVAGSPTGGVPAVDGAPTGRASAHVAALHAAAELVTRLGDAAELAVAADSGRLSVQVSYRGYPDPDGADADRDRLAGLRALARLLGVAVVVGFDTPERLTLDLAGGVDVGGIQAAVWTTVTDPGVRAEAMALVAASAPAAAGGGVTGRAVTVASFGYLHGPAPAAHVTVDLREHFRDPHVSAHLRELTAADDAVRDAVLATPGIPELVDAAAATVAAYLSGPSAGPVAVAVGCAGGRHRAPVVAGVLAARLGGAAEHRDLHRPVVERTAGGA